MLSNRSAILDCHSSLALTLTTWFGGTCADTGGNNGGKKLILKLSQHIQKIFICGCFWLCLQLGRTTSTASNYISDDNTYVRLYVYIQEEKFQMKNQLNSHTALGLRRCKENIIMFVFKWVWKLIFIYVVFIVQQSYKVIVCF